MLNPVHEDHIRVCHVAVADLWAGAEVQLKGLIAELARMPEIDLSVVLFNGGRFDELAENPPFILREPQDERSGH